MIVVEWSMYVPFYFDDPSSKPDDIVIILTHSRYEKAEINKKRPRLDNIKHINQYLLSPQFCQFSLIFMIKSFHCIKYVSLVPWDIQDLV